MQSLLVTVGTLSPVARPGVQVPAKIFPLSWLAEFLPLPPPTKSCWVTGNTAVLMYQCLQATCGRKGFFQERHLRQSLSFPTSMLLATASSLLLKRGDNLFQQHKLLERKKRKKKLGESVFSKLQDTDKLARQVSIKPTPVHPLHLFMVSSQQVCRLPKECLLLPTNLRKFAGGGTPTNSPSPKKT